MEVELLALQVMEQEGVPQEHKLRVALGDTQQIAPIQMENVVAAVAAGMAVIVQLLKIMLAAAVLVTLILF